MNDSRKGGLTFPKRSPQRLLMGVADREIVSVLSLADSNSTEYRKKSDSVQSTEMPIVRSGFDLVK